MQLKKDKILNALFKLSFVPYILLFSYAIYNAIFGISVFFNTLYGVEAYKTTIVFLGFLGCTYIPIFPVMFIYEIFYLIWSKTKKNKRTIRLKKDNKI